MNLRSAVNLSLSERHLLPSGSRVVVGVSGGADSLVLLHILAALRAAIGFTLYAATLDHGLRGAASAADAQFVVETARVWGIPARRGNADVPALAARQSGGIEAAARAARYNFLASVAREVGADRIAVAHHADDQVETVLLHLLRGAGIGGLRGMAWIAPTPGSPDLLLIRPLLGVTRAEIDAYCREHGIQPRHDASNDDLSLTRNRLRHQIIPALSDFSPGFERRLLAFAGIAAAEDDFMTAALDAAILPHLTRGQEWASLPRDQFAALHPALRRRFVLAAARELGAASVGVAHVDAAVALALDGAVGAVALLTGGVQLRIGYGVLIIEHQTAPPESAHPLLPISATTAPVPVAIPGVTPINGWSLVASLTALDGDNVARLAVPETAAVMLRGRRESDWFTPLGLNGHRQKVSKWMIDRKIPRAVRDRVPLLVINGEIAALYWRKWATSQRFAITQTTARVVYFRLESGLKRQ